MADKNSAFGVAIAGCGTVGGAVANLLTRDMSIVRQRMAATLELRHIVDVDFTAARKLGLDEKLFRTDLDEALNDPAVGAVVELVGGTTVARDIIERALKAHKHVVTANKALLARHGTELYALARRCGVSIAFEASCVGGVPIIRAICDGLAANRIDALYGIVNGTCNYILTSMTQDGQNYADALAQAQSDGLAEADPTLDVAGTDSAHKLAIMASLAFAKRIDLDGISVEGIDSLQLSDIAYGEELGYVVKLLAIAHMQPDGLSLRVCPAFISMNHPLAWVSGPFNAVSVYGHATGHTMYYGRGAGGMPTASAVLADLAGAAIGTSQLFFDQLGVWPDRNEPARQLPVEAVRCRHYLRVIAEDRPGVLAKIATAMSRHNISISSVLQHELPETPAEGSTVVPIVITTAEAREGDVRKALAEVDALDEVQEDSVCIAIVDEYPEDL
ncbi:MAG: homoserine dehydrogenase [Planctomycetes bacterium]|nr:homoserine dehydrogenase [Planctomycetota bacterium]